MQGQKKEKALMFLRLSLGLSKGIVSCVSAAIQIPCPSFPWALGFLKENPHIYKRFCSDRTHEIPDKYRDNTNLSKEILCLKWTKEIQTTQERKDKVRIWIVRRERSAKSQKTKLLWNKGPFNFPNSPCW